jgi:hypothetical protein
MTIAGILYHFNNRLSEVGAAALMIGYGLTLMASPQTADAHSFDLMGNVIADKYLSVVFLSIGVMRFAALVANGGWPKVGPRLRAAGAFFGGIIWTQMLLSLIVFGHPSLGFSVYSVLAALEFLCFYRAVRDGRSR